jgi:hypothetical protein
MVKGLSPIEIMIDKACGYNPEKVTLEQRRSEAVLRLVNAAMRYHKEQDSPNKKSFHREAQRLLELGW